MRIIAGEFKGKSLVFPKNTATLRPTKDMVKEAFFSIVGERLAGAAFLDVCAGTGSIGLEALSRGAKKIVFIEPEPEYIFQNCQQLNCLSRVHILKKRALPALEFLAKRQEKFELIYLDPPYGQELTAVTLNKIYQLGILKKEGWLCLEAAKKENPQTDFKLNKIRSYGNTKLLILEY